MSAEDNAGDQNEGGTEQIKEDEHDAAHDASQALTINQQEAEAQRQEAEQEPEITDEHGNEPGVDQEPGPAAQDEG